MEGSQPNCAFEIVDLVVAHPDGALPFPLRGERDFGAELQFVVDVVAHLGAVIDEGDVVPGVERVEELAVHQRLLTGLGGAKGIEAPLVSDQTSLKQEPVGGTVLLQMKESLFGIAARGGTEDDLPGEGGSAGEGVGLEEQGVLEAIKLDGFALGGVDQLGCAFNAGGVFAEAVEAVEMPDFRLGGGGSRKGEQAESAAVDQRVHRRM